MPPPIPALIQQQRDFFSSGETRTLAFRLRQLRALRQAIVARESDAIAALAADLGKPELEAATAETIYCLAEIDYAIDRLGAWTRPKRVGTPLVLLPGTSEIVPEPLGVVLIVAPWNYPLQLAISPLIGAIAAGNCATIKPSELAPKTAEVLAELVAATFEPHYVSAVCGDKAIAQDLLAERFDLIFFTGSPAVGKIVLAAAARHLTPTILELGGKSPCIVDREVPIETVARRIVWGKFLNAGQTCIAPDYLLVHQESFEPLMAGLEAVLHEFYGDDPATCPDYGRIVSDAHFERLEALLEPGKVLVGGQRHAAQRYFAPTILTAVTWEDPIMQAEIFGPILPVLTFIDLEDAIAQVNAQPRPLALYIFSRDGARQQRVLEGTSSGGACVNDTILHYNSPELPFGGVGNSGTGTYHGKASFDAFSHRKSIFRKPFWLDLHLRYPPYAGKLPTLRRLLLGPLAK